MATRDIIAIIVKGIDLSSISAKKGASIVRPLAKKLHIPKLLVITLLGNNSICIAYTHPNPIVAPTLASNKISAYKNIYSVSYENKLSNTKQAKITPKLNI